MHLSLSLYIYIYIYVSTHIHAKISPRTPAGPQGEDGMIMVMLLLII